MPVLFFLTSCLILFILFLPFKETINLFTSAITSQNQIDYTPKSIFDEDKPKKIETVNNKLPSSQVPYPSLGKEYGAVVLDKANVQSPLIYGDSPDELRVGVGHFNGSVFPGEEGTTLIGGHNTADLAALDGVEKGDTITIKTNYETYQYKVNKKKVAKFNDKKAIETLYDKSDDNKLILYTCYPISMIGLTEDRLFVYADLVEGKMIDPNE